MIVASANLLDDSLVPSTRPQFERLPKIATDLSKIAGGFSPDILFMCEGANDENIEILADELGLELAAKPLQYSPTERMAIAVLPSMMHDVQVSEVRYGKRDDFNPVLLIARFLNMDFIGIHHPHRMIFDTGARHEGTKLILQNIHPEIPTIIAGDANALWFQKPRTLLTNSGLIEVHKDNRPGCPTPAYKHLTGIKFMPHLAVNLDIMMHSSHYIAVQKDTIITDTDHPVLWADLQLNSHTVQNNLETFSHVNL